MQDEESKWIDAPPVNSVSVYDPSDGPWVDIPKRYKDGYINTTHSINDDREVHGNEDQ